MTLPVPWPSTAIRISAIRIAGNESWMSTMRMISDSVRPPKYAAGRPVARPMTSASDRRGDADAETDAQPVEDRRQHVAALVVGAEPERPAGGRLGPRRQPAVHDVELREVVRVLRRDQRREQREQQDHAEQHEAEHRDRIRDEIRRDPPERRLDRGVQAPAQKQCSPSAFSSRSAARADRAPNRARRRPG